MYMYRIAFASYLLTKFCRMIFNFEKTQILSRLVRASLSSGQHLLSSAVSSRPATWREQLTLADGFNGRFTDSKYSEMHMIC